MAGNTAFPNGLTADLIGDVTGDITGNVTGDITGDITGGLQETIGAQAAAGTIAVPDASKVYIITAAASAAIVLAAPTATTHDGRSVTLISKAAAAHSVTHGGTAGFNNAGTGADAAIFGGAAGDGMKVVAYQGAWYTVARTNITLE